MPVHNSVTPHESQGSSHNRYLMFKASVYREFLLLDQLKTLHFQNKRWDRSSHHVSNPSQIPLQTWTILLACSHHASFGTHFKGLSELAHFVLFLVRVLAAVHAESKTFADYTLKQVWEWVSGRPPKDNYQSRGEQQL